MRNKGKLFIPIIISSLILTGCGSEKNSTITERYSNNYATYEDAPMDSAEEIQKSENENSDDKADENKHNTSDKVIKKEMLVYSCNLTVDVLDFDTAMKSFRNSLNVYEAFVEKENYSNGSNSERWIYDDNIQFKTYNATIRVPSKDYDAFCETTANLGDLKNKDAHVDNLTAEYNDLTTTLEIYEARKDRLVEMLENSDDEQTIITLEKELTEIQIDISTLETRINQIQTDVAYSFVYVTLNEVKEYEKEPVIEEKTDTFGERFQSTVSKSTKGFLAIMEKLLFLLIYMLPHIIVISLVTFAIVTIAKKIRKQRKKNCPQAPVYPNPLMPNSMIQNPMPVNSEAPPVQEEDETANNEES